MNPTAEQAEQFALMLQAGLPAAEALLYFLPEEQREQADPGQVALWAKKWANSKAVAKAMVGLQQGEWSALDPKRRIELALEKHYNEMAYFLYTHNYVDLNAALDRAKADTCRVALEAKLAGLSGSTNALAAFWQDVSSGKLTLAGAPQKLGAPLKH